MLERSFLKPFIYFSALCVLFGIFSYYFYPALLWSFVVLGPCILVGYYDIFQTHHSILRNYPLIGRLRFLMEDIRPEIQQYFVESDTEGRPFNRQKRSLVYQRSKNVRDTIAYGTLEDLYEVGYEWVNHSVTPKIVDEESLRIHIGGPDCSQPYDGSILYISAMSFGALSQAAVRALNWGAKLGNFIHNTGEGGLSSYHLEHGGDLIWQIGTGYFGCRSKSGGFDPGAFEEKANHPHVKMIELKISQGAKPGHGGILPAAKVTPEIAKIRTVPVGEDVNSPPAHKEFSTPLGLLEFLQILRRLSNGKPVGLKLCVGKRREFLAICKAMVETGITPDYITVDGGEGGSGATPLEFANRVGCPMKEALVFVHNALIGYNLRDKIKLSANSKVITGFDLVVRIALGADMCGAARAFMQSIGCIQALKCNQNVCPVGVTTQNPDLIRGLHVESKKNRVVCYHHNTLHSVAEIIGAMGLSHTDELQRWHIMRRTSAVDIKHYGEIYHYLNPGELLKEPLPPAYARACRSASSKTFGHISSVKR